MQLTLARRFATQSLPRKVHGFTVQKAKSVPELQLHATLLRHDRTGAEHLHVQRDDTNNVFSIGFATPPPNSTGIPHILEHTTLCGSHKYPVRDPFFKMLNRTLANYMNAFTASDYTFYPFATVNEADHANLRDVYLDATLSPRLREIDFMQEGWRLEHQDPKDTTTPIVFKGVVYNEMKGQTSDANYIFYIHFQRHMYQGTIYANDSGGDPQKIPDLTHEHLVRFHHDHYHPSNSKIFTYGSFPLDSQLQAIDKKLSEFDPISATPPPKDVRPWSGFREVNANGPFDPLAEESKQIKTSLSWLTNDVSDVFETFSLRILSTLLLDGHSSPFYQGLIEKGLGTDYSPNTGYDSSTKTAVFSIGLQGVSEESLEKFKTSVPEILESVKNVGFPKDKIDGILHQMEIALKRKSANFGMSLLNSLASGWFNKVDPLEMLSWNETVDRFKAELAKGPYLENLIEKYLIRNDAKMGFTMRPLRDFQGNLLKAESENLLGKVQALTNSDRTKIRDLGLKLIENQDAEEDLSCLPTLKISDIPKSAKLATLELGGAVNGVPVDWNLKSTGLTYFRMNSNLENLPEDLRPYLPLFTDCFTNLGTQSSTMAELEDMIKLKTGGISVSTNLCTDHSDLSLHTEGLVVSGYCLDNNITHLFKLMGNLLTNTNYDNTEKLRNLIKMNSSGLVGSIAESGHSFARTYASSVLTPTGRIAEILGGMSQVKLISEMAAKSDLSDVIGKLKRIARIAFTKDSLRCFVTCGPEMVKETETEIAGFTSLFEKGALIAPKETQHILSTPTKAFFPLPYSVNFSAMALKGVPYSHPDGAALQVLAKLMTNKFLHREIREKGGAYGGGATFNAVTGIFGYYSYRDPNTLKTLQTMERAGAWASEQQWSAQDLDEAKLSIFQSVDAPTTVSREGMIYFTDRITNEMRQKRRAELLDVQADAVRDVANKYLVRAMAREETGVAILGEKADWLDKSPNWTVFNWGSEAAEKVDSVEVTGGDRPVEVEQRTGELSAGVVDKSSAIKVEVDEIGQRIHNPRRGADGELQKIEVTERAVKQIAKVMQKEKNDALALRVTLESGGCHGYQYVLSLTDKIDMEEDVVFERDGSKVVVDEISLELIDGSKVDYTMELIGSEFKVVDNPRAVSKCGCDTSIDIDIGKKAKKN